MNTRKTQGYLCTQALLQGDDRPTLPDGVDPGWVPPRDAFVRRLGESDDDLRARISRTLRGGSLPPDTSVAFERGLTRFLLAAVMLVCVGLAAALLLGVLPWQR